MRRTPASPPTASAQSSGGPISTERAPNASDLPNRLKQGAIVLEVQFGTLKQRFFVTLDFGG